MAEPLGVVEGEQVCGVDPPSASRMMSPWLLSINLNPTPAVGERRRTQISDNHHFARSNSGATRGWMVGPKVDPVLLSIDTIEFPLAHRCTQGV